MTDTPEKSKLPLRIRARLALEWSRHYVETSRFATKSSKKHITDLCDLVQELAEPPAPPAITHGFSAGAPPKRMPTHPKALPVPAPGLRWGTAPTIIRLSESDCSPIVFVTEDRRAFTEACVVEAVRRMESGQ